MGIRQLMSDDAAAYFALRLEGLKEAPKAFALSVEEERHDSLETVAVRLTSQNTVTLGAFKESKLVGIATFIRAPHLKTRHNGWIVGVYVAGDSRGRGIGRALLNELLARVRDIAGVERVSLSVATTQVAAQALYRSLGFEVFGLERAAIKHEYVDEEHMTLFSAP